MNAIIKTLYFLISDNKVLVCQNNVKEFWEELPEEIKVRKAYSYFVRLFKEHEHTVIPFNMQYTVQRITYNK